MGEPIHRRSFELALMDIHRALESSGLLEFLVDTGHISEFAAMSCLDDWRERNGRWA